MKEIRLTRGLVAIVDDEDYESLSAYRWYAKRTGGRAPKDYACRSMGGPRGPRVLMHRTIINAPAGMDVDHINGDALDNRRCNLRVATRSQNLQNRPKQKNNSSGYKGVSKYRTGRWMASIRVNGTCKYLGYHSTPEAAHAAYCAAAKELHGEFARSI
jgi:hypothetical protein